MVNNIVSINILENIFYHRTILMLKY